jgi:hypothetical protein
MAHLLKMATVQQALSLRAKGWSQRRIARELGISRDAVARYVQLAQTATAASQPTSAADGVEPVGAVPGPPSASKPAPAPSGFWSRKPAAGRSRFSGESVCTLFAQRL